MKKSHLFNEHGESDPLALEDSSGKTNTTTNQIGYGTDSTVFSRNDLIPIDLDENSFQNQSNVTFFENDSLKLVIQKAEHKKFHKFSFLDSLFEVKILPKAASKHSLFFKDLLEMLDQSLKYILEKLQSFFPDNPNPLCFLTLFQDGMISGLSTGGYSLADESDKLVDRLMQILYNFLISNENLTVNNGFKIFVDVYSKEHAKAKKNIYKGRRGQSLEEKKRFWSLDFQLVNSLETFLLDKCLLIAITLGFLQNCYLENSWVESNARIGIKRRKKSSDKRYTYAQEIYLKNVYKQKNAIDVVKKEVKVFLESLKERSILEYWDLDIIAPVANELFDCQLVVFSGLNYEIKFMYPKIYDESLRPIYLFEQNESSSNTQHLIFIRHLKAFFRSVKKKSCFYCKKVFRSFNIEHRCSVRKTCLACRRFFTKSNVVPSKFHIQDYCSGDQTLGEFLEECKVCQLKLLNESCATRHRKICGKNGFLGFKCKKCNKYFSRNKQFQNIAQFQMKHTCGQKLCSTCKTYIFDTNHLCHLRKTIFTEDSRQLAFLTMEFCQDKNGSDDHVPNCITVLKENNFYSGIFDEYQISDFEPGICETKSCFSCPYFESKPNMLFPFIVPFEFSAKLLAIKSTEQKLCLGRLLQLLVSWTETVVLCKDDTGFIFQTLIKLFLRANLHIKINRQGKRYFSVELSELRLKFLNLSHFLSSKDLELAYPSIHLPKFFPLQFNIKENYEYNGEIPGWEFFADAEDSSKVIAEKQCFISNHKDQWNFKDELKAFSQNKSIFICASTCNFLKEVISLQSQMRSLVSPQNPNKCRILWPFSNNICTLSGFIFKLFKGLFLNDYNIYCVKNEYSVPTRKVSQTEYQFCKYLEAKFPALEIIHNFSNPQGQKYFKDCVPDIYIPETKTAVFMNGCYFHGHHNDRYWLTGTLDPEMDSVPDDTFDEILQDSPCQESCLLSKPAKSTTVNKRMGKSYSTLQTEFYSKLSDLKRHNPGDVKQVRVFWECFYKKKICKTKFASSFLGTFKKHPLKRLIPRDCVVGGLLQTFAFQWDSSSFPDETFYCCDMNGLYSHAAMTQKYNVGKYTVIIGKDTSKISTQGNKFFFENKEVYGTALVTVLPPKGLFYPFLTYKDNGKSVPILCLKCYKHKVKKCKHSDQEREFFGSFFIEELEFALHLGYKVKAFHEVHAYFEQEPVFQKFVSILDCMKLKFSTYLEGFDTDESKDLLCYLNNYQYHLPEPFKLTPQDSPNKFKRQLYKLAANSLYGKFQQRKDKLCTSLFYSDDELDSFVNLHKDRIQTLDCFEDVMCQVTIKPKLSDVPDSLDTNCYLGAQVVAHARIIFYKEIQKVLEKNAKLFYVDTDCIFFTLSKDQANPLLMSDYTGQFKHVFQNVTHFYCLGSKNYCISYLEDDKVLVTTKVKGLNLNASVAENSINADTYRNYLSSFLNKKTKSQKILQVRTRCQKKKPFSQKTKLETVTFSNKLNSCRFLKRKSPILTTFPCGY